jgi:hypothetical protein
MSGLTGNNILAGSSGQGGYEIEQSLRFNDDDSPRLTRQYVSAGNRKIYTLSCWVKRGALGDKRIFGADGSSNFAWVLQFDSNNKISVGAYSGGYIYQVVTTAVYRDVGAWYHIVVATDTTQATASDRIKIYVNGEQVTAFDTASYPSLNLDTSINNNAAGRPHGIGYIPGSGGNYDGYLAELNVVDGQALTPSDFGETDLLTNQWIPKKYVGTYGTNGFYLNFSDSASLGADSSGNGNNFTPTNLAATDQVLDSPTNNFATLNPLNTTVSGLSTISEGNLKTNVGGTGTRYISSATQAMTFGKWYCEVYVINTPALTVGLIHGYSSLTSTSNGLQMLSNGYSYNATGIYVNSDSITASGLPTYSNGDVIGIMYDADVGKLEFVDNTGTKITTVAASGLDTTVSSFFAIGDGSSSTSNSGGGVMNFGQDSSFAGNKTAQGNTDDNGIGDFYYTPPSGYLALCEDNLPDPSIADPTAYFNTVLYTGNGSTQSITGVGFQPDFVWLKERSSTSGHRFTDAVRGAGYSMASESTDAENYASNRITSFDSDGFSLGNAGAFNESSQTYVAWNWKANGSGSSNTDGTITSTVSANTTAGFSIVSYTGNTATDTNYTVGHGLSQTPDLLIIKNRDWASSVSAWQTWHTSIGNNTLALDTTNANNSGDFTKFLNQQPNSTVFTVRADTSVTTGNRYRTNGQVNNYIAYCFHSVEGYSKFGSYTGNGSTDGPFVYTGFRPAFLMVKLSTASGGNWLIADSTRSPQNVADEILRGNTSGAETDSDYFDFLSNGFKIRDSLTGLNGSGNTYIYMAFAENPFKYSNAR